MQLVVFSTPFTIIIVLICVIQGKTMISLGTCRVCIGIILPDNDADGLETTMMMIDEQRAVVRIKVYHYMSMIMNKKEAHLIANNEWKTHDAFMDPNLITLVSVMDGLTYKGTKTEIWLMKMQ